MNVHRNTKLGKLHADKYSYILSCYETNTFGNGWTEGGIAFV